MPGKTRAATIARIQQRPVLPEQLAASEQAQLEAARARRGWRPISRALPLQFNHE
jgi:hypothetical protein